MTEDAPVSYKRIIEPFVYFPNHASAIPGLGGVNRSPDPNYCFHTHYFEYAPGKVIIHITLPDVQATVGELSIRIHAYRPDNQALGIKMVAAHRENLTGLSGDHHITVKFAAIPGVHYAVYGFFTEPSDITAKGIDLIAEEFGDDNAENYTEADVPQTILSAIGLEKASALVANHKPNLRSPVSQICTLAQLDDLHRHLPWDNTISDGGSSIDLWRHVFSLRVLEHYGFLQRGSRCLLLEPVSDDLGNFLSGLGCSVERVSPSERIEDKIISHDAAYFDFAICTHPSGWIKTRVDSIKLIDELLQKVMAGGFAVIIFDYDPYSDSETALTKVDIERVAFHILGHGHSLSQLNFASGKGRDAPPSSGAAFAMVIQR